MLVKIYGYYENGGLWLLNIYESGGLKLLSDFKKEGLKVGAYCCVCRHESRDGCARPGAMIIKPR